MRDLPTLTNVPQVTVLYWVRGSANSSNVPNAPSGWSMSGSVADPPCSGHQTALVMSSDDPRYADVLCPTSLGTWTIPVDSIEFRVRLDAPDGTLERVITRLSTPRLGVHGTADAAGVARFLRALSMGDEARAWTDWAALRRAEHDAELEERSDSHITSRRTAKPAPASMSGVQGRLKVGSRRHGVLQFFLDRDGTALVTDAMRELKLDRNGVLSHLWGLKKFNGVEYSLSKDGKATVVMPCG